ncbi:hypothetical protein DT075_40320 [Bacillus licheniformis]|nr:hypothetical protein DT075_40320 [Bacillus licheniformis]
MGMLYIDEREKPLSLQIFGGEKETLVEAAKFVDQNTTADIIDINMGCPVPKITKCDAGAKWLLDNYLHQKNKKGGLKMFKIGDIELKNRVVLAPMAGVCNSAFRLTVKEFGAGLVCAEMVSDKAILYNNAGVRVWKQKSGVDEFVHIES